MSGNLAMARAFELMSDHLNWFPVRTYDCDSVLNTYMSPSVMSAMTLQKLKGGKREQTKVIKEPAEKT